MAEVGSHPYAPDVIIGPGGRGGYTFQPGTPGGPPLLDPNAAGTMPVRGRSAADILPTLPMLVQPTPDQSDRAHQSLVSQIALSTSAIRIVRSNPNRVSYLLQNLGNGTAYVGPNGSVLTTTGYPIAPNGGVLRIALTTDADIVFNDLYAIASVATTLALWEVVLE